MHINFDDVTSELAPDMLAAMPDGIAMSLGQNVLHPHPFAEILAASPLRRGAYAAGLIVAPRRAGEAQTAVIARGLRSFEFSNAFATGLQAAARARFDKQATHRAFVAEIEVQKMGLPEIQPKVELNGAMVETTRGNDPQQTRARLQDGESMTLLSFERRVDVSREQVFNDDQKEIAAAVSELGISAARHEARLVVDTLEANPNMRDGVAVFHATPGNILATAFGDAALAAALAALRNQQGIDGLPMNAAAAHLVVSPALEYSAYKLVRDAGITVLITVLSGLPSGRYFLLTASDIARTIAVARLAGYIHPLVVEPVKTSLEMDGVSLRVRLDVGANMIDCRGILRGGS